MIREIKFRAWLKEAKMMVEVTKIDFANQQLYFAFHSGDIKNTELMQYTGLKDKNGLEIYEGDIRVDIINFSSGPARSVPKPVKWDKRGNRWNFTQNDAEKCEIIGNIYENPELLK